MSDGRDQQPTVKDTGTSIQLRRYIILAKCLQLPVPIELGISLCITVYLETMGQMLLEKVKR